MSWASGLSTPISAGASISLRVSVRPLAQTLRQHLRMRCQLSEAAFIRSSANSASIPRPVRFRSPPIQRASRVAKILLDGYAGSASLRRADTGPPEERAAIKLIVGFWWQCDGACLLAAWQCSCKHRCSYRQNRMVCQVLFWCGFSEMGSWSADDGQDFAPERPAFSRSWVAGFLLTVDWTHIKPAKLLAKSRYRHTQRPPPPAPQ